VRKLGTQYIKGIYSNPVTLKSRSSHSRLLEMEPLGRPFWRWILLWPWTVG